MFKNFTVVPILFALLTTLLVAQIPKSLFVANSLGQNISTVNLENGNVNQDALPLGLFPNFIKIRGDRAYVINSGTNEVQIVDLASISTIASIDLGASSNPWAMDFINDSLAAVSLWLANQVAIINVNTRQIIQHVAAGTAPEGVKYFDGKIYVANSGYNGSGYDPGTISVIDASSFVVLDTIAVSINPQDLDVSSQGQLVVICTGDYGVIKSQLDIIDLGSSTLDYSIILNLIATGVRVNSLNQCYMGTSFDGVMVYNLNSESFERDENQTLPGGSAIVFDQQNNAYLANFNSDSVYAFSSSHQEVATFRVGDGPVSLDLYDPTTTSIREEEELVAKKFILNQNYPNPFNPNTLISYQISRASGVELIIFTVLGQRVKMLVQENQPAGYYEAVWDGTDESGALVASGIYLFMLKTEARQSVKKMHLIR